MFLVPGWPRCSQRGGEGRLWPSKAFLAFLVFWAQSQKVAFWLHGHFGSVCRPKGVDPSPNTLSQNGHEAKKGTFGLGPKRQKRQQRPKRPNMPYLAKSPKFLFGGISFYGPFSKRPCWPSSLHEKLQITGCSNEIEGKVPWLLWDSMLCRNIVGSESACRYPCVGFDEDSDMVAILRRTVEPEKGVRAPKQVCSDLGKLKMPFLQTLSHLFCVFCTFL